jgi:hypothetical protein
MNSIIYTAQCGEHYNSKIEKRKDIFCFEGNGIFKDPVMEAKRYKILGHQFFPEYDVLVWIDANITLLKPLDEIIKKYLPSDCDIAINRHPYRDCMYKEFDVLLKTPRFVNNPWLVEMLEQQRDHYEYCGFPKKYGFWENNFIIRRNEPHVNSMFNDWWAEICRWQWRDQVSFPVVYDAHKNKVRLNTIDDGNIRQHKDFEYKWHY